MCKEEDKSYIEQKFNNCRQLVHASNILEKYTSNKHLEELKSIIKEYKKYLEFNSNTIGYDKKIIEKRVEKLNIYYDYLHENQYDNLFTSQSKFRSTILEEFMFFLFRDYVADIKKTFEDEDDKLNSGYAKSYENLYFTSSGIQEFIKTPQIKINEKDQDFAIYRNVKIDIDSKVSKTINVPVVAIENKTYVDKTMLDSVMSIADKIKQGNPYVYFSIVTETYDVDFNVDPVYSNLDQIYVLRKCRRKAEYRHIEIDIVYQLFSDVKKHLERQWSNVEAKLKDSGLII